METAVQISSSVNERRMLEHLGTFFSSSSVVLAELMQNARRAEAGSVHFEFDAGGNTLSITDDGYGIADFRALVTLAGSDWSQEVMDAERPFGIGFFSVCFAADGVLVQSRGKEIHFSAGDLIEKRPIAVKTSDFIGGTRILLAGCGIDKDKVGDALRRYAKGFAIPVFWQGAELPRPHAQARLPGVETPVGFIHVPELHRAGRRIADGWVIDGVFVPDPPFTLCGDGAVYCQGLPVEADGFSKNWRKDDDLPVIHVDIRRHTPRMPDRDALVDGHRAARDFEDTLRGLWREYLLARKTSLSDQDFAQTYWKVARKAGCLDVMHDVDVIPGYELLYVTNFPILGGENFWDRRRGSESVTRSLVEAGKVTLYRAFNENDDGADFLRLSWARSEKALFVPDDLPADHWAQPYLRDLAKMQLKVSGQVLAKGHFEGAWVSGGVKLVESLALTLDGTRHLLPAPVAAGCPDKDSFAFLFPKGGDLTGYVVKQAQSYLDYDDHFCEPACDEDAEDLRNLVEILAGEPLAEALKKRLVKAGIGEVEPLRNTSFHVRVGADGEIMVAAD
jgi:hypothetical protein